MKIRTGFVSNSSSSSYIIAIAKVVDKEKFHKMIQADRVFGKMTKNTIPGDLPEDDNLEYESYYGNCTTLDIYNIHFIKRTIERAKQNNCDYDIYEDTRTLYTKSFMCTRAQIKKEHVMDDNAEIVIISYYGSEEDSFFYNDKWGEYDYNMDESYFMETCPWVMKILDNYSEYGLDFLEYDYGAGRDG